MEWSRDELIALISAFQHKEVLWNVKHAGYAKRGLRELALREVVATFPGKGMLEDVSTGTAIIKRLMLYTRLALAFSLWPCV